MDGPTINRQPPGDLARPDFAHENDGRIRRRCRDSGLPNGRMSHLPVGGIWTLVMRLSIVEAGAGLLLRGYPNGGNEARS